MQGCCSITGGGISVLAEAILSDTDVIASRQPLFSVNLIPRKSLPQCIQKLASGLSL